MVSTIHLQSMLMYIILISNESVLLSCYDATVSINWENNIVIWTRRCSILWTSVSSQNFVFYDLSILNPLIELLRYPLRCMNAHLTVWLCSYFICGHLVLPYTCTSAKLCSCVCAAWTRLCVCQGCVSLSQFSILFFCSQLPQEFSPPHTSTHLSKTHTTTDAHTHTHKCSISVKKSLEFRSWIELWGHDFLLCTWPRAI